MGSADPIAGRASAIPKAAGAAAAAASSASDVAVVAAAACSHLILLTSVLMLLVRHAGCCIQLGTFPSTTYKRTRSQLSLLKTFVPRVRGGILVPCGRPFHLGIPSSAPFLCPSLVFSGSLWAKGLAGFFRVSPYSFVEDDAQGPEEEAKSASNQGKTKGQQLKGKIVHNFHTFSEFLILFHHFSPRIFPFKTKGLAQ